jgi:hypothetical protein
MLLKFLRKWFCTSFTECVVFSNERMISAQWLPFLHEQSIPFRLYLAIIHACGAWGPLQRHPRVHRGSVWIRVSFEFEGRLINRRWYTSLHISRMIQYNQWRRHIVLNVLVGHQNNIKLSYRIHVFGLFYGRELDLNGMSWRGSQESVSGNMLSSK